MNALEMGAVHTLIVWEELDVCRFVLKNSRTGGALISFLVLMDQRAATPTP